MTNRTKLLFKTMTLYSLALSLVFGGFMVFQLTEYRTKAYYRNLVPFMTDEDQEVVTEHLTRWTEEHFPAVYFEMSSLVYKGRTNFYQGYNPKGFKAIQVYNFEISYVDGYTLCTCTYPICVMRFIDYPEKGDFIYLHGGFYGSSFDSSLLPISEGLQKKYKSSIALGPPANYTGRDYGNFSELYMAKGVAIGYSDKLETYMVLPFYDTGEIMWVAPINNLQ